MNIRFFIILSLALVIVSTIAIYPNPVRAQDTDKGIATCSAIDGDLARLECFDNLSKERGLDKPKNVTPSIEGKGAWIVSVDINPIDDSKTVILKLYASSGQSRWDEKPSVILRCRSNETDLYINWHDYLGSKVRVLTRIGNKEAKTKQWSMSSDKKASFYPGSPIAFIKEMMQHDRLVAQVTPYNESPVTAIFNTEGLENVIKPLQETCNWD